MRAWGTQPNWSIVICGVTTSSPAWAAPEPKNSKHVTAMALASSKRRLLNSVDRIGFAARTGSSFRALQASWQAGKGILVPGSSTTAALIILPLRGEPLDALLRRIASDFWQGGSPGGHNRRRNCRDRGIAATGTDKLNWPLDHDPTVRTQDADGSLAADPGRRCPPNEDRAAVSSPRPVGNQPDATRAAGGHPSSGGSSQGLGG